jgi:hypothetical protein
LCRAIANWQRHHLIAWPSRNKDDPFGTDGHQARAGQPSREDADAESRRNRERGRYGGGLWRGWWLKGRTGECRQEYGAFQIGHHM